jgi:geranylgeranyl diphosphate synthase type II
LRDNKTKIESVKDIFNNSGASKANQDAIQEYTFKAFETLEK